MSCEFWSYLRCLEKWPPARVEFLERPKHFFFTRDFESVFFLHRRRGLKIFVCCDHKPNQYIYIYVYIYIYIYTFCLLANSWKAINIFNAVCTLLQIELPLVLISSVILTYIHIVHERIYTYYDRYVYSTCSHLYHDSECIIFHLLKDGVNPQVLVIG